MSTIDYSRLRSLKARDLISAVIRDGFEFDRQRGSHHHYYHIDNRRVTISFHSPAETFPPKTLKRIIEEQAEWTEADLRRLKLLK